MNFKDIKERVEAAEICICDNINGKPPAEFISKNRAHFKNWVIEDDELAGVFWIYDRELREKKNEN